MHGQWRWAANKDILNLNNQQKPRSDNEEAEETVLKKITIYSLVFRLSGCQIQHHLSEGSAGESAQQPHT